jgi:hypothetical protein
MFEILKNSDFNSLLIDINEFYLLKKNILIQLIVSNEEFLKKIIDIDKNITNYELNDEMMLLKNNILMHEKLNEIVEFDGFEIVKKNLGCKFLYLNYVNYFFLIE